MPTSADGGAPSSQMGRRRPWLAYGATTCAVAAAVCLRGSPSAVAALVAVCVLAWLPHLARRLGVETASGNAGCLVLSCALLGLHFLFTGVAPATALAAWLLLTGAYLGLVRAMAGSNTLEPAILVMVLSVLTAILLPVFEAALRHALR